MPPTITTDTGAIAVPMSTILDALEGVLTDAEREALMGQLIGLRPDGVAPGDLIEAALFNQFQSDLNDLKMRVALLEQAGDTTAKKPVIHEIVPQIVRTGDDFQVIGENLNPNLLSRIEVDSSPIPLNRIKSGSGPTKLILEAPAIVSLPTNGGPVILTVQNAAGTAQGSYIQLPGIAAHLQATAFPLAKSIAPVEKIKANTTYKITYDIEIHSSHDEQFQIKPHIDQGWTAVVDGSDKIAATAASSLAGLTVSKVINVTSAANGSANLTLEIVGTSFPDWSSTGPILPIAVGQDVVLPSNQIQINSVTVDGPHGFSNNVIQVFDKGPQVVGGATVTLNVQVLLKKAATYNVQNLTATPATDWAVTGPASTVATQDGQTKLLAFTITPKKITNNRFSSAPGTVSFAVTSADDANATTSFSAQLQVIQTP